MLIIELFYRWLRSQILLALCQKGNAMLSVYIVVVLSSILFGLSLRSFRVGVLSLFIVLGACDLAVYYSNEANYVGPVLAAEVVLEVVDTVNKEMAVAEEKAEEYNRCMDYFLNKAWDENQIIPSQRSLHFQCIKVAAERSLP